MTGWKWQRGKTLDYLTIPEWSKWGVKAVFSIRKAGVSKGPYSSLNLALHVNDQPEDVLQNRKIFLAEFGSSTENCVAAEQIHGIRVVSVSAKDKGLGMLEMKDAIPQCDGMVTVEGIGLFCFYADCVPLYFYNPPTGMVGLAHAGWQGTAQKIVKEVLTKIKSAGGFPEDCFAAIGPCIGSCCYQVGENVASIFRENFNDSILTEISKGKYRLDLVEANRILLISEGIPPENISIAGMCTACHSDLFYSYRREGITGRMAAFIIK